MNFFEFSTRYPEFASVDEQLIEKKLAEAAERISATAFGSSFDTAQGLFAAHLLWSSPFGASMRLEGGGEEQTSRYWREYSQLRVEKVPSVLVL